MAALDRVPVRIPQLAGPSEDIWRAICALADRASATPWTVVGGQMVFLHAAEHGVAPHRLSSDIDAAGDLRADPDAIRKLVDVLRDLGFNLEGVSPEGAAYRFARASGAATAIVDVTTHDAIVVDLLAPEGLGDRADLTTLKGGTAFVASGVTQALERTERVPVEFDGEVHWVPRPNLLGAIVAKAAAAAVDPIDPDRHRNDVAFLCGLVDDPYNMAISVTRKDRRRLRAAAVKLPRDHKAWRSATSAADAFDALKILIGN